MTFPTAIKSQKVCQSNHRSDLRILGRVGAVFEYPIHAKIITVYSPLAAPVEAGMMLAPAPRPARQSLPEGPSTVFWVAVVA